MHKSPVVYRYIKWSIAAPSQKREFNPLLKAAVKPVGSIMLWRRLCGTVAMLEFVTLVK